MQQFDRIDSLMQQANEEVVVAYSWSWISQIS